VKFGRLIRHILTPPWSLRRVLPEASLKRIEQGIGESEGSHRGQIRFAVEVELNPFQIVQGVSARDRAIDVFSHLRIWDTEDNTGVLLYLLLADKQLEIVADRCIHKKVGEESWTAISRRMEAHFREGKFEEGVLLGIREITVLLTKNFPATTPHADELSNKPVVI